MRHPQIDWTLPADVTCLMCALFHDATRAVELRRQAKLRKPSELPLESDVICVRNYIQSNFSAKMTDTFMHWSRCEFIRLRALMIVCRLTLFNACRGGEPARLLLTLFSSYWLLWIATSKPNMYISCAITSFLCKIIIKQTNCVKNTITSTQPTFLP